MLSDLYNAKSLKGLGALTSVGEDLIIRRNSNLATMADLGTALETVGANGGGSIYIQVRRARSYWKKRFFRLYVVYCIKVEGDCLFGNWRCKRRWLDLPGASCLLRGSAC